MAACIGSRLTAIRDGTATRSTVTEFTPPAPSAGEAQVRVCAVAIPRHVVDINSPNGDPLRLGGCTICAGQVESLGEDVPESARHMPSGKWVPRVGSRVIVLDGSNLGGSIASHMTCPWRCVVPIPEAMPLAEAAALAATAIPAYVAVFTGSPIVEQGCRVVILGADSAAGTVCSQLLGSLQGIEVVGICAGPLGDAARQGADRVVSFDDLPAAPGRLGSPSATHGWAFPAGDIRLPPSDTIPIGLSRGHSDVSFSAISEWEIAVREAVLDAGTAAPPQSVSTRAEVDVTSASHPENTENRQIVWDVVLDCIGTDASLLLGSTLVRAGGRCHVVGRSAPTDQLANPLALHTSVIGHAPVLQYHRPGGIHIALPPHSTGSGGQLRTSAAGGKAARVGGRRVGWSRLAAGMFGGDGGGGGGGSDSSGGSNNSRSNGHHRQSVQHKRVSGLVEADAAATEGSCGGVSPAADSTVASTRPSRRMGKSASMDQLCRMASPGSLRGDIAVSGTEPTLRSESVAIEEAKHIIETDLPLLATSLAINRLRDIGASLAGIDMPVMCKMAWRAAAAAAAVAVVSGRPSDYDSRPTGSVCGLTAVYALRHCLQLWELGALRPQIGRVSLLKDADDALHNVDGLPCSDPGVHLLLPAILGPREPSRATAACPAIPRAAVPWSMIWHAQAACGWLNTERVHAMATALGTTSELSHATEATMSLASVVSSPVRQVPQLLPHGALAASTARSSLDQSSQSIGPTPVNRLPLTPKADMKLQPSSVTPTSTSTPHAGEVLHLLSDPVIPASALLAITALPPNLQPAILAQLLIVAQAAAGSQQSSTVTHSHARARHSETVQNSQDSLSPSKALGLSEHADHAKAEDDQHSEAVTSSPLSDEQHQPAATATVVAAGNGLTPMLPPLPPLSSTAPIETIVEESDAASQATHSVTSGLHHAGGIKPVGLSLRAPTALGSIASVFSRLGPSGPPSSSGARTFSEIPQTARSDMDMGAPGTVADSGSDGSGTTRSRDALLPADIPAAGSRVLGSVLSGERDGSKRVDLALTGISDAATAGSSTGFVTLSGDDASAERSGTPHGVAGPIAGAPSPGQRKRTVPSHLRERLITHHINTKTSVWDVYERVKELGVGMTGRVHLARHRRTGVPYAIKTIDLDKMQAEYLEELRAEISFLTLLDHPNVIKLYATFEDDTEGRLYLVLEYCSGGELFERLHEQRGSRFPECHAAALVYQMLSAVAYCHKMGIAHRDLKLENFLLESVPAGETDEAPSTRVVLIDFGLSNRYAVSAADGDLADSGFNPADQRGATIRKMTTVLGTAYYTAPEILARSPQYSELCDVWSVGVISVMLLSGSPPFRGRTDAEILERVRRGRYTLSTPAWRGISEEAKNFVRSCLKYNPDKRPSAVSARRMPWFARVADMAASTIPGKREDLDLVRSAMPIPVRAATLRRAMAAAASASSSPRSSNTSVKNDNAIKSLDTEISSTSPSSTAAAAAAAAGGVSSGAGTGAIADQSTTVASMSAIDSSKTATEASESGAGLSMHSTAAIAESGHIDELSSSDSLSGSAATTPGDESGSGDMEDPESLSALLAKQIDPHIADSLRDYVRASKLKRAALATIAFSISSSEVSRLRDTFYALDTDGTGILTVRHILEQLVRNPNVSMKAEEAASLLARFREDGQAVMSYSEFLAAAMSRSVDMSDSRLREAFGKLDSGGSGYITVEALRALMGDLYTDEELTSMIDEADSNNEGRLSFADFCAIIRDDPGDGDMHCNASSAASSPGVTNAGGNHDPAAAATAAAASSE